MNKKWKIAAGAVATLLIGLIGLNSLRMISRSRTFQFFGEIIPRVETDVKAVALTFDDGPEPRKTEIILATLEKYGVKASFFLMGRDIELHPDQTKQIIQAGHEVGNHSYEHNRMIFKPMSYYESEIQRTDALIRGAGYTGPIHFRAPNCQKLLGLPYYLKQIGRKHIIFDVEPDSDAELSKDAHKIAEHVIANARPGSIILLHVMYHSRKTSMDSVPEIIEGLKAKGYEFKTVSDLMELGKTSAQKVAEK